MDSIESRGVRASDDTALLAAILGHPTGLLGVAGELLHELGGVRGLGRAGIRDLRQVKGVGPRRARRLAAAMELGRRSMRRPDPLERVESVADATSLLEPGFRGLEHEELHALFLDRRHGVLAHRVLTCGSAAYTIVDPRQIFELALRLRASAIVLAHNHPSGDPEPSDQDLVITRRVEEAGRVLGVRLLDHLIMGAEHSVSLAARGELKLGTSAAVWTG